MIRIVLVDDHAVYRKSLRQLIEREPDLSVVAEAGDGLAAIEMVKEVTPDVVLIDVQLPKLDGLQATKIISSQHPGTKVIVLTLFTDDGTRVTALESGAHHCLAKDSHPQGLLAVIRGCRNQSIEEALYDVIKVLTKAPEKVEISELHGSQFKTFEVKVSIVDYNPILSAIDLLKSSALRLAGLPETEPFIVNLVLNDKSLYRPNR